MVVVGGPIYSKKAPASGKTGAHTFETAFQEEGGMSAHTSETFQKEDDDGPESTRRVRITHEFPKQRAPTVPQKTTVAIRTSSQEGTPTSRRPNYEEYQYPSASLVQMLFGKLTRKTMPGSLGHEEHDAQTFASWVPTLHPL